MSRFEVGQHYKTRDGGETFRILAVDGAVPYPVVALSSGGYTRVFTQEGLKFDGEPCPFDIVPNTRIETRKVWVNVYDDNLTFCHPTETQAKNMIVEMFNIKAVAVPVEIKYEVEE